MSYQRTVEQLYALGHELATTPSHKFDLAYVREMLEALDNPERRFASVLIAGTNGKGSTAATLSSILRVAGYKTGLYSSPHLVRINERIRVNGETISDAEFGEIYDRVERTAQQLLQCRQAALASQLLRDADGDGVRILRQHRSRDCRAGSRHGRPPGRDQCGRAC